MTKLARAPAAALLCGLATACSSLASQAPGPPEPVAGPSTTPPEALSRVSGRHAAEWNRPPGPAVPVLLDDALAAARRVIKQRRGAIFFCYERRLGIDHGLAGRIGVEFAFPGDERVEAHIVESSVPDAAVEGCIVRIVRDWRLDARQAARMAATPGLRVRVPDTFVPSR